MDEPDDLLSILKKTTWQAAKGTPRAYFAPVFNDGKPLH